MGPLITHLTITYVFHLKPQFTTTITRTYEDIAASLYAVGALFGWPAPELVDEARSAYLQCIASDPNKGLIAADSGCLIDLDTIVIETTYPGGVQPRHPAASWFWAQLNWNHRPASRLQEASAICHVTSCDVKGPDAGRIYERYLRDAFNQDGGIANTDSSRRLTRFLNSIV